MSLFKKEIDKGATFSPCRYYRYLLWRTWGDEPPSMFIGLNPSTADETKDDPTIRRCINFATAWGCGGIVMTNIFAFRATLPAVMKGAFDPIGPDNLRSLQEAAARCSPRVACWGVHGEYLGQGNRVQELIDDLQCFGLTKHGFPKHPLYLPKTATLVPFARKERA